MPSTQSNATSVLTGRVERITLRRLKDGQLTHDTTLTFDPGQWARSVRLTGHFTADEAPRWREGMLKALARNGYDVPEELPTPRWHAQTQGTVD